MNIGYCGDPGNSQLWCKERFAISWWWLEEDQYVQCGPEEHEATTTIKGKDVHWKGYQMPSVHTVFYIQEKGVQDGVRLFRAEYNEPDDPQDAAKVVPGISWILFDPPKKAGSKKRELESLVPPNKARSISIFGDGGSFLVWCGQDLVLVVPKVSSERAWTWEDLLRQFTVAVEKAGVLNDTKE